MTRRELMELHPPRPVRSLGDLPETDLVWTAHVHHGALAHRKARLMVAVCGVAILEWPVCAGHLAVLGGGLCPTCWTHETSAGNGPAEMEEI